jgi:DNA adenine methylase
MALLRPCNKFHCHNIKPVLQRFIMARSSTSFQPKWKLGNTTVVRVPQLLAPAVLRYAHDLDDKTNPCKIHDSTVAYRTVEDIEMTKPVNVASVPQRSPFRYPGGKTWLVPYIRSWLVHKQNPAGVLVEPFAGGGIVGLTSGFEGLAEHVVLVERDPNVAAVWHTILGGQAKWLADQILNFDLNHESVTAVLRKEPVTQRERAFAVILRNRVQRGGIMAEGAGLVKTGENGRGLNSRWYPETLARRILEIASVRERFSFIEGDAFEIIRRYADDETAVFFADPPYTIASKRLYSHWQVDHRSLFGLLASVKGDVLMTYDNTREIAAIASEFDFETQAISMKNTHHAKMTELVIGRDLDWLRKAANGRESGSRNVQATLAFRQ